jgi:peptide/nickel transport system substrate-binding protein
VRHHRRGVQLLAVLFCLTLLATACGSDKKSTSGGASGSQSSGGAKRGGTLILGAEQWPECLNPITQCANSSWMHWAIDQHVLPRLMDFDKDGNFIPSPVLAGQPVVDGKGTGKNDTNPFSVTYKIKPEAVWDDGTPISADDIEFTANAKLKTTGVLSTIGYDKIDHIEKSDGGKTAKVVFKDTYADWGDMWGGLNDYVLKKAAFKSEETSQDLVTSIPFSGKGFKLESFSKDQAVLVPNPKYWDQSQMPLVDKVILKPQADTDTELNALKAGEVYAIYPQPSSGIKDKLSDPSITLKFGASVSYEGIWFDQGSRKNPDTALKEKAVREALLFAIDRQAILDQVIHNISPDVQLLNCAGWVPTVGKWCNQNDFADVKFDKGKVDANLTGAGWAKGPDGIYAKGGKKLSLTWQTVAGNKRRESIQDLIIPKLHDLGIEVTKDNSDADTLFQTRLPNLDTEIGLYIQNASPDPTVSTQFACESIPTPQNNFSGQNNTGWCNQKATDLMHQADVTLDENKRLDLTHQIGKLEREDAVWLPLYQFPVLTAFRSDKIEGAVGDLTSSPNGGFENIYDWSLK